MILNQKLFTDVGVSSEKLSELAENFSKVERLLGLDKENLPSIVCAGIYNAGKSTLLNALTESDHFPTGAVPTTKEMTKCVTQKAVFIDTPGLNANEEDDDEAEQAYKKADVILFVSSAQNGGIGQVESRWLQKLYASFPSKERFQERFLYALSQCDEIEPEKLQMVADKFKEDFHSVLGFSLDNLYLVDAHTWETGVKEDSATLKNESQIPALRELIENRSVAVATSRLADEKMDLEQLKSAVLSQFATVQKQCEEEKGKTGKKVDFSSEFDKVAALIIELTQHRKNYLLPISPSSVSDPSSRKIEENSRSSAEREARSRLLSYTEKKLRAVESAIREVASEGNKMYGNNGPDSQYFHIKNKISSALEELFEAISMQGCQVSAPTEFKAVPDLSDSELTTSGIVNQIKYYATLESASKYVDSNLYKLDIMESTKEVKGMFGILVDKPIYQIFGVYQPLGAIDSDISSALKGCSEYASSAIAYTFNKYKDEIAKEATAQMDAMKRSLEQFQAKSSSDADHPVTLALEHLAHLEKEVQGWAI